MRGKLQTGSSFSIRLLICSQELELAKQQRLTEKDAARQWRLGEGLPTQLSKDSFWGGGSAPFAPNLGRTAGDLCQECCAAVTRCESTSLIGSASRSGCGLYLQPGKAKEHRQLEPCLADREKSGAWLTLASLSSFVGPEFGFLQPRYQAELLFGPHHCKPKSRNPFVL